MQLCWMQNCLYWYIQTYVVDIPVYTCIYHYSYPVTDFRGGHRDAAMLAAELNRILQGHVVAGELTTFGCVEWQSQLFRGVMCARCYPFDMPTKRFHGFKICNCSLSAHVCVCIYEYIHWYTLLVCAGHGCCRSTVSLLHWGGSSFDLDDCWYARPQLFFKCYLRPKHGREPKNGTYKVGPGIYMYILEYPFLTIVYILVYPGISVVYVYMYILHVHVYPGISVFKNCLPDDLLRELVFLTPLRS